MLIFMFEFDYVFYRSSLVLLTTKNINTHFMNLKYNRIDMKKKISEGKIRMSLRNSSVGILK
jgi:hypothetical protein